MTQVNQETSLLCLFDCRNMYEWGGGFVSVGVNVWSTLVNKQIILQFMFGKSQDHNSKFNYPLLILYSTDYLF